MKEPRILETTQFASIQSNSSKALDALLSDLKEHPKRYVHFSIFGRKEKSSDENKK